MTNLGVDPFTPSPMNTNPLERLREELSRALDLDLKIQSDMIALEDETHDAQVSLTLGVHDGWLHLICPVAVVPDNALSWSEPDDEQGRQQMLRYGAVSRMLLQLNGDTEAHAQCRLALDSGTGQLLLMERLPATTAGAQVLTHIHALGAYLARIRQALQTTLHDSAHIAKGANHNPEHRFNV